MAREIVIGTRDSALALWQTHWVRERLQELFPDRVFRIVHIKTKGDKILDVALAKIGDKGLFTKELEVAMQDGEIDLAVHSMKDLPTVLPEGLIIGAIAERVDPCDVLISPKGIRLQDLPAGAVIGTSSLRRIAQLLKYRPDLKMADLRGNLNTRMNKLDRGDFDAIILAAAGVERMGWAERITDRIPFAISLPAVGQGSVGVEIREDDQEVYEMVQRLNHRPSELAILAERAMLRRLEGGCQVPIGSLGRVDGDNLELQGMVASLDGQNLLRSTANGSINDPAAVGQHLAAELLAMGAKAILDSVRE